MSSRLWLVLEASTPTASVAIWDFTYEPRMATVDMRARDGEHLLPAVNELFRRSDLSMSQIERVIVSSGPGGFTGLRIAAAIGKGLAESLGTCLFSVSSLALLAAGDATGSLLGGERNGSTSREEIRPVIAILDAMRDEWYAQRFSWGDPNSPRLQAESAVARLRRPEIEALAARTGARIVGVGGGTFEGGRESTPNAHDIILLMSSPMVAEVDVASWEPDYGRLAEAQVKWEAKHGRSLGEAE